MRWYDVIETFVGCEGTTELANVSGSWTVHRPETYDLRMLRRVSLLYGIPLGVLLALGCWDSCNAEPASARPLGYFSYS